MKNLLVLVLIIISLPFALHAEKQNIKIDVEVLLDGKTPLSGGYINIVNQIPRVKKMPSADTLGIRVLDRDGKVSIYLKDINRKGLLNITILRDRCDWYSDFHDIDLNHEKGNYYRIVLKPKSQKCD